MEKLNADTVRRYFAACQSGVYTDLVATFDPDVIHYFLPRNLPPIRGAGALATFLIKYKQLLDPLWHIDHLLALGDEVVIEWACVYTSRVSQERTMNRGTEWYVIRDGKIVEIRAYTIADPKEDVFLAEFPYEKRGYFVSA